MDAIEAAAYVENSEQFRNASLEQKIQLRAMSMDRIKQDQRYYGMSAQDRDLFKKRFMTAPMAGLGEDTLINGDEEDQRSAQFLNQAFTARDGMADMNFGEGFTETVTNFVTGKLGAYAVDLFTEEDTTKKLFGDRSDSYKAYRDYVLSTMDPEGITDWKVGKVVGAITGFGGDALASAALYGGVGAPGVLTQGVSKIGTYTGARKALTYVAQFGIEGAGYLGEEAIADAVTGELSRNTKFNDWLSTVPGDFAKGVAMAGAGEILGIVFGGAGEGVRRVFSKEGLGGTTQKMANGLTMQENLDAIVDFNTGKNSEHVVSLLKSEGLPPAQIRRVLNSYKESVLRADPTNYAKDPEGFTENLFKANWGMDVKVNGDAVTVNGMGGVPLEKPITATSTAELHRVMKDLKIDFDNKKFEFMSKVKSDKEGTLSMEILTKEGQTKVSMNPVDTGNLFRPIDGKVDVNEMERVYKALTALEDVKIVPVENYFKSARTAKSYADSKVVLVPGTVKDADEAVKFSKDFFKQVKAFGEVDVNSKELEAILRSSSGLEYNRSTLDFFYRPQQMKFNDEGLVSVKFGEEWSELDTIERAARDAHIKSFSEDEINSFLATEKGLHLFKNTDGTVTLKNSKGSPVYEGVTLQEVFDNPMTAPPLKDSMKPEFKMYTPADDVQSIKIEGKDYKTLKKNSKKFMKNPENAVVKEFKKQGTIVADPKFLTYRVTMGDNGLTKDFKSLKSAQEWLSRGMGDKSPYALLEQEAWDRGLRLTPHREGYVVEGDVDGRQFFRDLDSAEQFIATKDDILSTKELFSDMTAEDVRVLEKQMIEEIKPALEKAQKAQGEIKDSYKGYGRSRVVQGIDRYTTPIRERFAKIGDATAERLGRQVVAANKAFQADYNNFIVRWRGIMKDSSHQEKRFMSQILGAETSSDDWPALAEKMGIELTDKMFDKMTAVRKIFDSFGSRFSIDPNTWIKEYFPKLRDMTDEKINALTDMDSFKKYMGKTAPTEIDAFFRHNRIEDHIQARYQDDIDSVMETYVKTGLRELHLNSSMEEARAYIRSGKGSKEASDLLYRLSEQASGRIYSSERAVEVARNLQTKKAHADKILAGEGKYKKLTEAEQHERAAKVMGAPDTAEIMSDLVTASVMSFKYKMPIRNLSQTFSISATMLDAQYIKSAWQFMGSDIDQVADFYTELFAKGVIPPRADIDQARPAIYQWLKKANDVGMKGMYQSDDFNRMVTSFAVRERFSDGISLMQNGKLDTEGFMKFMKINWLSPDDQAQFAKLLGKGDLGPAETMAMRRITEMTQFEYGLHDKPEGLTSGVGKIFGKFGTYSSQYMQFAKRGWKAEGLAFATKLTAGAYLISTIYSDLLNIDHISPSPWETIAFTGSPLFASSVSIYDDFKNNRLTVKSAAKDFSVITPFFGQGRSMAKGLAEISEGSIDDGLTYMLGATPPEEKRIDKLYNMFQ